MLAAVDCGSAASELLMSVRCRCCLQEPFHRRLAFDIGDLGLGVLTNSLELGKLVW